MSNPYVGRLVDLKPGDRVAFTRLSGPVSERIGYGIVAKVDMAAEQIVFESAPRRMRAGDFMIKANPIPEHEGR